MSSAPMNQPDANDAKVEAARAALGDSLRHLDIVPASMASEAWVEFTNRVCQYVTDLYTMGKRLRHPLNTTLGRSDFVQADQHIRGTTRKLIPKTVGAIGAAAIGAAVAGICQPLADGRHMTISYVLVWAAVAVVGFGLAVYQFSRE